MAAAAYAWLPSDSEEVAGRMEEGVADAPAPLVADDATTEASVEVEPSQVNSSSATSDVAPAIGQKPQTVPVTLVGQGIFYHPEPAIIRVGDLEMQLDLKACAPGAIVFNVMRQRRRAGLPRLDATALFPPRADNGHCTENRSGEVKDAPSADASPTPALASDGAIIEPPARSNHDLVSAAGRAVNDDEQSLVDLYIPTFPGGMPTLRSIVRYLEVSSAEERAAAATAGHLGVPAGVLKLDPAAFHLDLNTDNIAAYLEAGALLRCPRILRETVLAPAAKDLPSRQIFALLGMLVRFTVDTDLMIEGRTNLDSREDDRNGECNGDADVTNRPHDGESQVEEQITHEQVVQAFCQAIQRLCARLDAVDFKLSANLGLGSPWASLEVLKAYKVKVENIGRVNYALQSMVTSTAKLFFYEEDTSGGQIKQQEWKEHHFALHVFRKHIIEYTLYSKDSTLRAIAERALLDNRQDVENPLEGNNSYDDSFPKPDNPEEADDDIPDAICDRVPNECLAGLAAFVAYCEPMQTPPVLAALMVRALLLTEETTRARVLFEAIFVRSRKAQNMVIAGQIPVDFLLSVKTHRSASIVLRRILGGHELKRRAELCLLLDNILLEEFQHEKHCHELIMDSSLARDLTVYCRVSTREVAHLRESSSDEIAVIPGSTGQADALRLRKVGERLFATIFVTHRGFLPAAEEESSEKQLLNWTAAECPWDSGDLDLQLLQHVPKSEDALHLSRRVLLRGLLRRQRAGVESDVRTTMRLWALGQWPSCHHSELISEAFSFLSTCWRNLQTQRATANWPAVASRSDSGNAMVLEEDAGSTRVFDEEALFKMFTELEFWRLQPKDLMTPWAPPHLLACHIASRCKILNEHQNTISEGNRQNLQEINRLRQTVIQLHTKLEVVDARSVHCMEKQYEVSDAVRSTMAS